MSDRPTRTYSTCGTCEGILLVTELGQVNHDSCKRDTRSVLADQYVAAVERGDTAEADRLEATIASHERDDRNRSLAKTALWYARRSWPVFPLRPGDKRPLTEHGFQDATTDLAVIREWWRLTPGANIGVATGVMFDVLDIDWKDKEGNPSRAITLWPDLRDGVRLTGNGVLPDIHGVAITPRSGLHILVEPQGTGNLAGRWHGQDFTGLDYRGLGGYIVVAPSRYGDGRSWQWVSRPSPRITNRPDWADGDPMREVLARYQSPPPQDTTDPRDIWRAAQAARDRRARQARQIPAVPGPEVPPDAPQLFPTTPVPAPARRTRRRAT